MRSLLTLSGIAVGIAAVILLTSIGEGIHRYVLAEFSQTFKIPHLRNLYTKVGTFGFASPDFFASPGCVAGRLSVVFGPFAAYHARNARRPSMRLFSSV